MHVYSPIVDQGEFEIETRADGSADKSIKLNGSRSSNIDIGYGVTSFWATEIEAQWKKIPQAPLRYDSTAWENRFQATPQGEYWLDAGLFMEYEKVAGHDDHDNVTFGFLLQKELGQTITKLNLLLNRELGTNGHLGFTTDVRLQSVWRLNPAFQPGLELYMEPGRIGDFNGYDEQRCRLGPVVSGMFRIGQLRKIKYELGYLFGTTHSSEQSTVRAMLEYEARF